MDVAASGAEGFYPDDVQMGFRALAKRAEAGDVLTNYAVHGRSSCKDCTTDSGNSRSWPYGQVRRLPVQNGTFGPFQETDPTGI